MDDGSKMALRAADGKRGIRSFCFPQVHRQDSIHTPERWHGSRTHGRQRRHSKDYSQGARPVRRATGAAARMLRVHGVGSAFGMSLGMMNRISSSGVTKPGEIVFTKGERPYLRSVSPTSAGRKNSSSANSAGDAGLDDRSLPPQWRAPSTGDTTMHLAPPDQRTPGLRVDQSLPRSIVRKVTRLDGPASHVASSDGSSLLSSGSQASFGSPVPTGGGSGAPGETGQMPLPLAGGTSPVRAHRSSSEGSQQSYRVLGSYSAAVGFRKDQRGSTPTPWTLHTRQSQTSATAAPCRTSCLTVIWMSAESLSLRSTSAFSTDHPAHLHFSIL